MARSILAIVAGFLTIGLLAVGADFALIKSFPAYFDAKGGTTHPGMLAASLVYVAIFATFGCWLTARLAPSQPMKHALVLGGLGLVFNIMGSMARWETAPVLWYHAIGVGSTMIWAWLGGLIRERQIENAAPARPSTVATA